MIFGTRNGSLGLFGLFVNANKAKASQWGMRAFSKRSLDPSQIQNRDSIYFRVLNTPNAHLSLKDLINKGWAYLAVSGSEGLYHWNALECLRLAESMEGSKRYKNIIADGFKLVEGTTVKPCYCFIK